jgi:hypothetical protein
MSCRFLPNYLTILVLHLLQVASCVGQVRQVAQEQVQTDYLQAVLYLTCQHFWVTSGRVTLQVAILTKCHLAEEITSIVRFFLLKVVSLCEELGGEGGAALKAAAQNTAAAGITTFARFIRKSVLIYHLCQLFQPMRQGAS